MTRIALLDRARALIAEADEARLRAIVWILEVWRDGMPTERGNLGPGVSTPEGMAASHALLALSNVERLLALGARACIGGSGRVAERKP